MLEAVQLVAALGMAAAVQAGTLALVALAATTPTAALALAVAVAVEHQVSR